MLIPENVRRYLQKHAANGPWQLTGMARRNFADVVVIPSLAEGDSLFKTLESLAGNPAKFHNNVLVLIVINHGEKAEKEIKLQNINDLSRLADYAHQSPLNLAWVDAATPGLAIPDKVAGVGFARKLGLDTALSILDWSKDPLLICLDADTLVENNYLQVIQEHFRHCESGAAVLPYQHQPADNLRQQAAIDRYEIFLRSYVYGLRLAGSPYAFNSVGSAMACRALAYVRCGGMNKRKAGEDFYFLQKLAKTDGVGLLTGTTVWPAPRVSERVPFGTGRSMSRMLSDDFRGILIYPVEVFSILGQWLECVNQNLSEDAESILTDAAAISPILLAYLEKQKWRQVWMALQATHKTNAARLDAFHGWFDGFKSLRFIHLLCEKAFMRGEPERLLPGYFARENVTPPPRLSGMLRMMRKADNGNQ